jgi:lipoyl(octanoyl) transferase
VNASPEHRNVTTVGWAKSQGLAAYAQTLTLMQARAASIADRRAGELVWCLEHPPLYTAGVSAKEADLLAPDRFSVFRTERGGQFTYHGPGQRVAYVMLDLTSRGRDVHAFVEGLETWLIEALALLDVEAFTAKGRVGVWVVRPGGREEKIAAIGVRLKRWVSFHGIALNVAPDLSHFSGITPCGIAAPNLGVTSLEALGKTTDMAMVDQALRSAFETRFGPTKNELPPAPAPRDSEDAFYFDELMTAQPEATQAYLRERLRRAADKDPA